MNEPGVVGQFLPEQVTTMTLPVISRSRFAQMIGIEEGVVQGWIAKGYIPTYSVGKYTLINVALLNKLALDNPVLLSSTNEISADGIRPISFSRQDQSSFNETLLQEIVDLAPEILLQCAKLLRYLDHQCLLPRRKSDRESPTDEFMLEEALGQAKIDIVQYLESATQSGL